ncbi:MAG: OmpA family protein [Sphingobacteriales bacterium JAD_PAG50586_3]|nr:MAG: OmpA family protein [Sphingobacteriales bacterium JAD_PAG50586_3]
MYFTICRDEAGYRNCDIYYSVFSNNEWGDITKLDGVNLPDYWESQPSVSSDGNTIYFASDRPGGQGGMDIYKTVKAADGKWGKPINLGPTINTDLDDKSPFFHTDGQTLYFSSEGHQNLGGFDIFFSKTDSTGKFLKPKNIGYPINTDKDDLGFFCSTDGKTGYFATDRQKGVGGYDIMGFDLYAAARPEKVLFVKGTLKDDAGKPVKNATVEIKNIDNKQITKVQVDTTTGRYVTAVALKSDYILTVKQPGTAFTSQYFSKADTATAKPRKVDLEVAPIKAGKAYTLNNINFATNSFELPKQSKLVVDEFAIFLSENPTMKVAIHGHTDDVGNDAANMTLSDNRAKAVYDYLVSKGIDSSRLSFKGFGETKPLAPNTTEPNRAKNRRTEFVIVAK